VSAQLPARVAVRQGHNNWEVRLHPATRLLRVPRRRVLQHQRTVSGGTGLQHLRERHVQRHRTLCVRLLPPAWNHDVPADCLLGESAVSKRSGL